MKRPIVIIISMLLICITTYAQNSWVGVSSTAFTTWQMDDSSISTSKIGAGAGIGFAYQWQKKRFIMEFGLDVTYNYHHIGLTDTLLSFSMIDTKGTPFQYKGMLANREDISHTMAIAIPMMFGMEFNYLYFLAGINLNLNIFGTSFSCANLTTSGKYDIFYDELVNIPSHGFADNQPITSTGNITYNIDIRPSIEFGTVFNNFFKKSKVHLGIYAEYGILNTLPSNNIEELIIPNLSQYMQVDMNHFYTTPHASYLHNFVVGVRFKAFLQIINNNKNKCRCWWE